MLKDGRIAAGQDTPPSTSNPPHSDKVGHFTMLTPAHPFTGTLAISPGTPCGGLSWNSLWEGGYQVAVVVATRDFDSPPSAPAVSGRLGPDTVLVVSRPLK